MTATRSRKQVKIYTNHRKHVKKQGIECEFCEITSKSNQFIKDREYFKLIRNIFPYTVWDDQVVSDHLLLVPKMHTDTLSEVPEKAAKEFISILSAYESEGYNILARAPDSGMKSVPHQHTHLIKLKKQRIKLLFFIRKPYIRLIIK